MNPHTGHTGSSRVLAAGTGLTGLPSITRTADGFLRVEYLRRVGAIGLGCSVQFGTDLTNEPPAGWEAASAIPAVSATGDPGWARVVVVDVPPVGATRRFARVVVSETHD